MSFWKRIASLFSPRPADGRMLDIYVLSHRGRVPIAGRVDRFNELSLSDEDTAGQYHVRKVLHTAGERRNFAEVEVMLWLDKNKEIIEHEVQGGRWLDENEYLLEVERFNTPDEEDEIEEIDTDNEGEQRHAKADDGRQLENEQERPRGDGISDNNS